MESIVLFYIELVPPQPISIIPAQFTFKIHATFVSNVIQSSIFRSSYIIFYFLHCVILLSLSFFLYSVCDTRNILQIHGKYSYSQNILTYIDILTLKVKLFILVVNTCFGDKSQTAINKLGFASIQLMRFNDMLKVAKSHEKFPQNVFHLLCFDFEH